MSLPRLMSFTQIFWKAFDRLDDGILMEKLLMFGLTLNFIESYIDDKTLWIQCFGFRSGEFGCLVLYRDRYNVLCFSSFLLIIYVNT